MHAGQRWQPRVERISAADGLPSQITYSLAQDRAGYLWIGSAQGLIRYDGLRFVSLLPDPADPQSISSANASQVWTDREGTLWVGTWGGGLNRVDGDSLRARHWRFDTDDPNSLASNYVQTMFQDSRGRYWFGTGAGLMGMDPESRQLYRAYTGDEGAEVLNEYRVWSIAEDAAGVLWLATSGGVVRFDPASGRSQRVTLLAQDDAEGFVRMVYVDHSGGLWIGGNALFGRLDPGSGQVTRFDIPGADGQPATVNAAVDAGEGKLWLATWSGLRLFDLQRRESVAIAGSGEMALLEADDIRSVLIDRSGLIWAATRFNGIARIEIDGPRFRLYQQELVSPAAGSGAQIVRAIYRSGDKIWLNTEAAVIEADLEREAFVVLPSTRGLGVGRDGPAVRVDSNRAMLPTRTGAYQMDLVTQQLLPKQKMLLQAGIQDHELRFAFRDSRDRIWWGANREGVLVSDLQGELIEHIVAGNGVHGQLADSGVNCATEDQRGRIWLCGVNGLSMRAPEQSGFRVFRRREETPGGLSHSSAAVVFEDSAGRIWVGTSAGLDLWDESSQGFTRVAGRDLPVDAIAEAPRGTLWLVAGPSLQAFDAEQRRVLGAAFDTAIPDLIFFPRAALAIDDHRLVLGSNKGLLLFDHRRGIRSPYQPPVVIGRLWVDRQLVKLVRQAGQPTPVEVMAEARSVEFEFSALDFRSPQRNRYRYQLQGFDPDWIDAGASTLATYTNLPAGNYRFRVRAAGADQVWADAKTHVDLVVHPHWWNRPRVWIGLTLSALVSTLVLLRLYLRRLRRREIRLQALVEERSSLITRQQAQLAVQDKLSSIGTLTAGVAHEINNPTNFAYAGAQNLQADLAAFEADLKELAGDDIDVDVAQFIRNRFGNLQTQVATVLEGAQRIRNIVSHLRSFARLDEAECKWATVDEGLLSTVALVRTQFASAVTIELHCGHCREIECWPAQLNQVFMNLIVNACQAVIARHGHDPQQGHLDIRSIDSAETVVVEFRDNGCGIPAESLQRIFEPFYTTKPIGEGSGLGLSISYGIVRRHGGRFDVESREGHGTYIRLQLPRQLPASSSP